MSSFRSRSAGSWNVQRLRRAQRSSRNLPLRGHPRRGRDWSLQAAESLRRRSLVSAPTGRNLFSSDCAQDTWPVHQGRVHCRSRRGIKRPCPADLSKTGTLTRSAVKRTFHVAEQAWTSPGRPRSVAQLTSMKGAADFALALFQLVDPALRVATCRHQSARSGERAPSSRSPLFRFRRSSG